MATYNHPETVDDILKRTTELYDKYGIDIYTFDSSASDATQRIVEKYIAAGAGNLYYIKLDEAVTTSSDKAVAILSGEFLKREYEYIFLIKDRTAFDEVTVHRIYEESRNGYDAIILPISPYPTDIYPQPETQVYTDAAAVFRDYGIYAPDWQTALFRFDTLLKPVDWNEFKRKYFTDGESPFAQVIALYNGLAALENPAVYVLRQNEVLGYNSSLSQSMWGSSKYYIWTKRWSEAIDALPPCYDEYKAFVKKKEGMQPGMFGSLYTIIEDVKNGVLTREIADELRDVWAEVSDIPYECLGYIFDGRFELLTGRLYDEWNDCFDRQEFARVYHMYCCNYWLKDVIGAEVYDTLGKCFEIYKLEIADGKPTGIFKNVHTAAQAASRYSTMTGLLKNLEKTENSEDKECSGADKNSDDSNVRDAVRYFTESGFSVEGLAYIIENECQDAERVVEMWESCAR